MMRTTALILVLTGYLCFNSTAQQLPNTNVYLFDLEVKADSIFLFSNAKYLTNFNAQGYNNQPNFVTNNKLYISCQFPNDTSQTDVYCLDIETREKTRVTATFESEYSPTIMPYQGEENELLHFSCVRVEADAKQSQHIWEFPLSRSNNGRALFVDFDNVGYHAWLNSNEAALFLVGDPHQLVIADKREPGQIEVASNIGRCLQMVGRGNLAFVHMISDKTWLIKKLNRRTYHPELVTATLPESEDFVVLPNETYLMAKGSKIYKFKKSIDIGWVEVVDLSYYNIQDISRMAINFEASKIAIVSRQ